MRSMLRRRRIERKAARLARLLAELDGSGRARPAPRRAVRLSLAR